MEMALADLRQDLSLSDDERVQSTRDPHDVPDGVVPGQHEQVLAEFGHGESGALGQELGHGGHGSPGIRGGVVDLEAVAGAQNGGLGDVAPVADLVRCGVPVALGNGELFTDLDIGVVNGEADTVNLKSLRGGLQSFLSRLLPRRFIVGNVRGGNGQASALRSGESLRALHYSCGIRCGDKGGSVLQIGGRRQDNSGQTSDCGLVFHG
mmetsp:Transcript_809/g.1708  ORF Transcript_809/g.1708 Transcript_809/m.1708 type:complete len:208 (-) Transcript_809:254-877(-)